MTPAVSIAPPLFTTPKKGAAGSILVIEDEPGLRAVLQTILHQAGYLVTLASSGGEALERIAEATPDLIISDINMPGMDGLQLLQRLRASDGSRGIPVIVLTGRSEADEVLHGFESGADDYMTKPFDIDELLARVHTRVSRPPTPVDRSLRDRQTGLLRAPAFEWELDRELARDEASRARTMVAYIYIHEVDTLRERHGARIDDILVRQVTDLLRVGRSPLDVVARIAHSQFAILMPETTADQARARLNDFGRRLAGHVYKGGGEEIHLTPLIGFSSLSGPATRDDVVAQAHTALNRAAAQLDVVALEYRPEMSTSDTKVESDTGASFRRRAPWVRSLIQGVVATVAPLLIPYVTYVVLGDRGLDITPFMYIAVVVMLTMTAAMIWAEGFCALRRVNPPEHPITPYPPATAIIAAYLPNEAATIRSTIDAFLAIDYPADLQIILAYNTPQPLPVEDALREIARRHPAFVPLRIEHSNSKAQNVNAALSHATGAFVAVFDADHQPDPGSFRRAWRWLSDGADVVQGHCLVRNGEASWVARTTAVEFETIYGVSHPGRARLHGFGLFGGSNGYWKRSLLNQTRMHGFMLTEDIDSSVRILEQGYKIVSDPQLISRELGPATLKALWHQRMRWAQGWFQVSIEHLVRVLSSRKLTNRQKVGFTFLLGWREVYPWLSLQMFPILAYWITRKGGIESLDWFIPVFVATTLLTTSVGPGQAWIAWKLAPPEMRSRRRWFVYYLVIAPFYTEFKNLIGRVAQIKQLMGEQDWRVTPRSAPDPATAVVLPPAPLPGAQPPPPVRLQPPPAPA